MLGDLLFAFPFEEARAQDLQGVLIILVLRTAVLAFHNDARWLVGEAHGRFRFVYVLTARSACAVCVAPYIGQIQLHVHVFSHRQDRHGRRTGVHTSLGLCFRHPLHPVHAAFVFQPAVYALTLNTYRNLLETTRSSFIGIDQFPTPTLALAMPLVHAVEITRKNGGFISASSRTEFHHHGAVIYLVFGQQ